MMYGSLSFSQTLNVWKLREEQQRADSIRMDRIHLKAKENAFRNGLPQEKYLASQNAYTGRFEMKVIDLRYYEGRRNGQPVFIEKERYKEEDINKGLNKDNKNMGILKEKVNRSQDLDKNNNLCREIVLYEESGETLFISIFRRVTNKLKEWFCCTI